MLLFFSESATMNSLLLLLLFHTCFCSLHIWRWSSSDTSNLKLLTNQLTSIKDVSKLNFFIDKHMECQIIQKLQGLLTRSLPIMSMENKLFKWSKFERMCFYERHDSRRKSREDRCLLNYPSKSTLFIYVFSRGMYEFCRIYNQLVYPGNIPRVLMLRTWREKKKYYVNTFNGFPSEMVDFEILEITSPRLSSNRKTKRPRENIHVFTVHQQNRFSKRYNRHSLSKSTTWFNEHFKNLHGYKMTANTHTENHVIYDPVKKREVKYDVSGVRSKLAVYLQESMNFTWKCTRKEFDNNVTFPEHILGDVRANFLNPCFTEGHYLYTPVIIDTFSKTKMSELAICFAVISMTCILLRICARLGGFDGRTWSPLFTAKMLIGLETPYNPQLKMESLLFVTISVCGIFCANDIYEGITGLVVPVQFERKFSSLQDLKNSNVSLFLMGVPLLSKHDQRYKVPDEVRKLGMKYVLVHDRYRREIGNMHLMLHWSNISISVTDKSRDKIYESKIVVNGEVRSRRSDISEFFRVFSIEIIDYSIFQEAMSESYWRFFEHGFNNDYSSYAYLNRKLWRLELERNLDGTPLVYNDDDQQESNFFTFSILLIMLTFGTLASFATLLIELFIHW